MTVLHVAVATILIYVQIATALNDTDHQALKVQINDAKHAKEFSTLLNSIVKVNKERYDTLKKMTRLQQVPPFPPRQVLRDRESDSEDSAEDEDDEALRDEGSGPEIVAYLVLPQPEEQGSSHESDTENAFVFAPHRPVKGRFGRLDNLSRLNNAAEEPLRTDDDENTLRSCHKRGYKKCKSACKSALRETCSEYTCKRSFKKKFKRECKRSCKSYYGSSGSGSDSD